MIHIFLDSFFILSIFLSNFVGVLSYYFKVPRSKIGALHHIFYFFCFFFFILKFSFMIFEFKKIYALEIIYFLILISFPIFKKGGKIHRSLGFSCLIFVFLVKIFPDLRIFQLTILLKFLE